MELEMNGNYEFVRQVSRDKQRALTNEATAHRLARQAGSPGGNRRAVQAIARSGAWFQRAVHWAAERAAGEQASWRALLHRPGAATR